MLEKTIGALMIFIGIIHILPMSGLLGSERLTALYGVRFAEENLEILMRHRSVLFGLLGAFFIYSAFDRSVLPIAFIGAFFSIVSFLALAWMVGGYNSALKKVVVADIVALLFLLIAVAMYWYGYKANSESYS